MYKFWFNFCFNFIKKETKNALQISIKWINKITAWMFYRAMSPNNYKQNIYIYIQGVLLPDWQTLSGDSKHEDKHY